MEIDKNALAQTYSTRSDNELLDLHAAGTLTEMAYEVLEAELAYRGVAIPKRPEAPEMIGDNEELHNYVMNSQGISRKVLNIMCFIGVFIFGWLLGGVFDSLGKKGMGWFYIVPIIAILVISRQGESALYILAPVIYIVGWIHANVVLSRYQALARQRIVSVGAQGGSSVELLLEKGLLYSKVLGDKESARRAFTGALGTGQGESADLFNRAGVLLLGDGHPQEAVDCFDRALSLSSDQKEADQIKKNRETAMKKVAKVDSKKAR